MFDLEKEVAAWSEAVHVDRCRDAARVAELSDHLHCEIDRARAEGLSDERAFAAAVARLGRGPELAAEHAKNRSILGRACAAVARYDRLDSSGGHRGVLIAHSMLWASVMLGTSLVMSKTAASGTLGSLLIVVLIPSWWGSELILRRALRRKTKRNQE